MCTTLERLMACLRLYVAWFEREREREVIVMPLIGSLIFIQFLRAMHYYQLLSTAHWMVIRRKGLLYITWAQWGNCSSVYIIIDSCMYIAQCCTAQISRYPYNLKQLWLCVKYSYYNALLVSTCIHVCLFYCTISVTRPNMKRIIWEYNIIHICACSMYTCFTLWYVHVFVWGNVSEFVILAGVSVTLCMCAYMHKWV